jgi:hypothetical protein
MTTGWVHTDPSIDTGFAAFEQPAEACAGCAQAHVWGVEGVFDEV